MPNVKKAELINGVVYMPSAVRVRRHGHPHFRFIGWLSIYEGRTPGLLGADNTTARLDLENEPQPDVLMFIDPAFGGQCRVSDDDYIEQAPELVAEISSSSVSFDLHTKFAMYRRSGVREYIVWRVADRKIDWFTNESDDFVPLAADSEGILRSVVFPGLWLDAAALVNGETPRVEAVARQGLASPEHADFVRKLESRRGPK